MASVVHSVLRSLKRHGSGEPTDGQLLTSFIEEQAEAAFTEIIHRHGAMVFGSARRLLSSATDAEDVYQAAFLLLARKARTLRKERSLAGWLYGVTRRLCSDFRKQQRRRQRREQTVSVLRQETESAPSDDPLIQKQEVLQLLHVEMARLSHDLREPLVLQCLEGLSHQQIADRLGVPMGTIASRLNRAKLLLKNRMMKRGVASAMVLALFGGIAQAKLYPPMLSLAVARAALTQSAPLSSLMSSGALALFQGELRMVWFKQLQLAAAAVLVGGVSLVSVAGLPAATVVDPTSPVAAITTTATSTPTAEDQLAKLQGTWYCVSFVPGGKEQMPPQELEAMKTLQLVIQGESLTLKRAGNGERTSTIKLDAISSPKRLELVNEKGTIMRALYMVDSDVLVMTFPFDSKQPFPSTLAVTKDLRGAMMVLQKIPVETGRQNAGAPPAQAEALKTTTQGNMRQLALAFHLYADKHGKFPRDFTDADGKPLLSWRVALLPFLEQNNLYNQFHLNEPWDSEHNKKLTAAMPKIFALDDANQRSATTPFQGFSGKGTIFEPNVDLHFKDVVDGTSNTIMFVEASSAVPWSKPEDITFNANKTLPQLGGHFGKEFQAVMLDGSWRTVPQNIKDATLKALITRAGGEIPALDEAKPGPGIGGPPPGR
ncbi:MAG: sigma-70 family RNA polymerase sigma factor [Gemmatales bacterium]